MLDIHDTHVILRQIDKYHNIPYGRTLAHALNVIAPIAFMHGYTPFKGYICKVFYRDTYPELWVVVGLKQAGVLPFYLQYIATIASTSASVKDLTNRTPYVII